MAETVTVDAKPVPRPRSRKPATVSASALALGPAGPAHGLDLRIGAEEFKILTIVENAEEFLVLARAEQVRTEPGAAAHHLPELHL